MSIDAADDQELFEDAPCGYVLTSLDGTILRVNRRFESRSGYAREQLVGQRRFQELLTPGGRIYHETHYAPLLRLRGAVNETAVELVLPDGSRLPALINSVISHDRAGEPRGIRTAVFAAAERRRYEEDLVFEREREHAVAHELQAALLAGSVPKAPDVDIAVAYRAGVQDLEVGGDWYDAFWLNEDRVLALVVGDVVGKGIAAAATMGQLRTAVRAFALTGMGPAALLETLDRYVERHGVGRHATLIYVELDLSTRSVRYACAGHPPPALLPATDVACLLWEGRSPPLAVDPSLTGRRAEGSRRLERGAALVLYTDGLIGRRDHPEEDGLERLLSAASDHQRDRPAELTSTLLRELRDDTHPDDACILAVRLHPPRPGP